jgi:WD40 repeat protein
MRSLIVLLAVVSSFTLAGTAPRRLGSVVLSVPWAYGVAYTPDGRTLVCAGDERVAFLDAATGNTLAEAGAPGRRLGALVCTLGGEGVLIGENEARAWIGRRRGSTLTLTAVPVAKPIWPWQASPDGRKVLVRDEDALLVLDAASGAEAGRIQFQFYEEHAGYAPMRDYQRSKPRIECAAWSADGRAIAVGREDGTFQVHDAKTLAVVKEFAAAKSTMKEAIAVGFSPEGRALRCVTRDGMLRLRPLDGGAERAVQIADEGMSTLWVTFAGRRALVHKFDSAIALLDVESGQRVPLALPADAHLDAIAFAPAGDRLAVTRSQLGLQFYDTSSGARLGAPEAHEGRVHRLAWSRDGRALASVAHDGVARTWDVASGRSTSTHRASRAHPIAFRQLFLDTARGIAGAVHFGDPAAAWAIADGAKPADAVFEKQGEPRERTLAFAAHAGRVATIGDGIVRVREIPSGRVLWERILALHGMSDLALANDGRRLALVREDTLEVIDVDTGRVVAQRKLDAPTEFLRFSDDGAALFAAVPVLLTHGMGPRPPEPKIRVLDASTLAERMHLPRIGIHVQDCDAAPGGLVAALTMTTNRILFRGPGKAAPVEIDAPGGVPTAVAFAPDGLTLAVGHEDGSVWIVPVPAGMR